MQRAVLERNRQVVAEVDIPDGADEPYVVVWRGRTFVYNSADNAYEECVSYEVPES